MIQKLHIRIRISTYSLNLNSFFSLVLTKQGFILLKATDFGLPQRRVRLFILGIHKERAASELSNTPEEVLDTALKTYLPMFKIKPCSVEAFLEDSGHFVFVCLSSFVLHCSGFVCQ